MMNIIQNTSTPRAPSPTPQQVIPNFMPQPTSSPRVPSPIMFSQQPPMHLNAPSPIHPSQLTSTSPINVPAVSMSSTASIRPPVIHRGPSPQELIAHTQAIMQTALLKQLEDQKERFMKKQQERAKSPNPTGTPIPSKSPSMIPMPMSNNPVIVNNLPKPAVSVAFTPTSVMRKMHSDKASEKDKQKPEMGEGTPAPPPPIRQLIRPDGSLNDEDHNSPNNEIDRHLNNKYQESRNGPQSDQQFNTHVPPPGYSMGSNTGNPEQGTGANKNSRPGPNMMSNMMQANGPLPQMSGPPPLLSTQLSTPGRPIVKDGNLLIKIERIRNVLQDENHIHFKVIERYSHCFQDEYPIMRKKIERIRNGLQDKNLTSEKMIESILKDFQDANDRKTIETREEKEKKEYIRQLFLMVLLLIILKNISGNIKCRQTSCRKYPCLNSILYLLWQSGDIEVNPGPANSTTYRNWLYQICSIVRKAIAGVPAGCKIWKMEPKNWPPGVKYSDPRNTKGLTVNKVEDFLLILIKCCDMNNLSQGIKSEIDAWNSDRSKDNRELLHLCRMRECLKLIEQVERSSTLLQSHLLPDEILVVVVNPCIRISLSCKPAIHQQLITHTIYRAEATRKIASFLCSILHGKDPDRKCDHIWTLIPDGWPSRLRYYNPNNGGERCAEKEDGMVVEALITLCGKKSIILSKSYQDMVNAWQAGNQTLLSKLLTRHTAETDLKKAVMKLHEERLLQDPEVDQQLRELGLLVQYDGSTQNVMSQKRKIVNTMNKHETKRTKQSDHKDAVDTTLKEFLHDCSIDQLLDIHSDSLLLDKISQNIPDFL